VPIRVRLGVGCLREGGVDSVAVFGSGGSVGCGPYEGVGELDAPLYLQEPGVGCRVGRSQVDAERLECAAQEHRIAEGFRGRGED
jgi:hypothetical protein